MVGYWFYTQLCHHFVVFRLIFSGRISLFCKYIVIQIKHRCYYVYVPRLLSFVEHVPVPITTMSLLLLIFHLAFKLFYILLHC